MNLTAQTNSAAKTSQNLGDIPRKAHARLAERIDPNRIRHKPLSLLRAEARRIIEQFLDADAPTITRADRDRIADDVLASANGLSALEELFRDDSIQEIMIINPSQVISRKGENWLPTSVRFRDAEQIRNVISRWNDVGESILSGSAYIGGAVTRLPNGMHMICMMPPEIMEQSPMMLLVRKVNVAASTNTPTPAMPIQTGIASPNGLKSTGSASISTPNDRDAQAATSNSGMLSGSLNNVASGASGLLNGAGASSTNQLSGRMPKGPIKPGAMNSITGPDLFVTLRQRLTERIVNKFASAGVYDLNAIPVNELRKIITMSVYEHCQMEKLDYDEAFQERLALEILVAMNR